MMMMKYVVLPRQVPAQKPESRGKTEIVTETRLGIGYRYRHRDQVCAPPGIGKQRRASACPPAINQAMIALTAPSRFQSAPGREDACTDHGADDHRGEGQSY